MHFNSEANLTFDGTDLNIATGSIEVRTIDYSDGDNAMTIADGGGVTFAQPNPSLKQQSQRLKLIATALPLRLTLTKLMYIL